VDLTALHGAVQPGAHHPEQSLKATQHPGVELRVGGHIGHQPGQRRPHHRTDEHIAGARHHRPHVGRDIALGRLQRSGRDREGRLVYQLDLARPATVQRGLGGAGPLGDGRHGQGGIADFGQQLARGGQHRGIDSRVTRPPCARGLVNRLQV